MTQPILFHCEPGEEAYLKLLKPIIASRATVALSNKKPTMLLELALRAKDKGCRRIATTSSTVLEMLVGKVQNRNGNFISPAINDFAGSLLDRYDCEWLILDPLDHLVKVPYGRFLYERYLSKFLQPDNWLAIPDFKWELFEPRRTDELLSLFSTASFMSIDIETVEEDRAITCLGATAVHIDAKSKCFTATTVVIPFTDLYNIAFARKLAALPTAKVFQNGKYDCSYLLRYNICPINYAFDTINLFHSWYSELPKDLGFITSFLLRKWQFWKGEKHGGDKIGYYQYNAKDAFSTAMDLLVLLMQLPEYAIRNYLLEFPVVFPCFLAEMQGLGLDTAAQSKLSEQFKESYNRRLAVLRREVANPHFNPGSWQQVQRLFTVLGSGDITGTNKQNLDKVRSRHPLNKRIIDDVQKYREEKKRDSAYVGKQIIWEGGGDRCFFALNPHGTDTSRLASKEHHFWCGLQIQNIPRDPPEPGDPVIKSMFVSDPGFYFGECDREQAEARDTAYLSGDTNLIAAVEDTSKDFHGKNASAFFGVPYEQIVRSEFLEELGIWVHKTIDKVVRDLSKRTNHGANYNMGAQVMLDTMGIKNVLRAKELLKLPHGWTLLQVCQYLLDCYAKAYPVVKGAWYDKVKADVAGSHMLVGPTGWTRYCFSDPNKSKRALNMYVAHPPQSLNAQELNLSYRAVFTHIWKKNINDFKLGPQIHDSILFQYRVGREDLAWEVKKLMTITTRVTDTFGITRDMIIPAALKGGATRWSEIQELKPANKAA